MVDGEAVLVVPSESRVIVLNSTAGFLWDLLEEPRTAEECARLLAENFEVNEDSAAGDVREFLREFTEKRLVFDIDMPDEQR